MSKRILNNIKVSVLRLHKAGLMTSENLKEFDVSHEDLIYSTNTENEDNIMPSSVSFEIIDD